MNKNKPNILRRIWRWTWRIALIGVVLLVLLLSAVAILSRTTDYVSRGIQKIANDLLEPGDHLRYDRLQGGLLNTLTVTNLSFEQKDGLSLKAPYVHLRYDLFPLLRNEIHVSRVLIDRLEIRLPAQESTPAETGKAAAPVNIDTALYRLQY
ncbi:MAG TPA: hypothetical protein ENJ89_07495, partial [Caldithrix abyssi]|nr:hypothetical protein [Caldithrix abyssi]